jgi:ATP-dependent protease HslVU (ClpYQ) ATPase subunit
MALTAEQQAEIQLEIDKQKFRLDAEIAAGIAAKEAQRDAARRLQGSQDIANEQRRNKMELVRLAKEVLIENNRSKPVDSRDLSADDITAYAQSLLIYVEGEQ